MTRQRRRSPTAGLTVLLASLVLGTASGACVEVIAPEPPAGPSYERTVVGSTLSELYITVRTDEWINEPVIFFPRTPREPFFRVGGENVFKSLDGGVVRAGEKDLRSGSRVRVWLSDDPNFLSDHAVYVLILEPS